MAPASGAAREEAVQAQPVAEESYALESAKARAEAAQRAYLMASIAAGLNPLNERVP